MRVSHLVLGLVAGLALTGVQAQITDTRDASTPGPGSTYFATVANQSTFPYYRYENNYPNIDGDWGWTHTAIGGTFASATLNISAYDVDADFGEVDNIYAWDSNNSQWSLLGSLGGGNDTWAFTEFVLDDSFYDEINAGLQIWMDIDSTNAGWAVALAKSSLSLDGGRLPPPIPNAVPETETYAMMLAGLGLITAIARRRKAGKSV